MFADWRRRFEKREAALAHIQQTDDFKASAHTMENIPDPKDKCSKRAWEYKLKELRVRIRSLKPDDETVMTRAKKADDDDDYDVDIVLIRSHFRLNGALYFAR